MKRRAIASFIVMAFVLTGCFDFKKQKVETLKVVNILDKYLYDDCHIQNSVHIPFADLEKQAQKWPKTMKIVIYCSNYSCSASGYAAKLLKKMGFEQVWAYEAGMAGWKNLRGQLLRQRREERHRHLQPGAAGQEEC